MSAVLDLRPALPALIVALAGLAALLAQAFTPRGRRAPSAGLALVGLLAALAAVALLASSTERGRGAVLGGTLVADEFALFGQALLLLVAILTVLLSPSYLRACGLERGEYYALTLFSLVGMFGLVSARELVALFVALEILSVALYGLAGMRRDRIESQEAALKYFLTGAFSSAFLLYGIALLYGATGSTALDAIGIALRTAPPGTRTLALLGTGFVLVGFGFKVASVPFHMWAPDVYEGAPTPVTAFMAAGVKIAAFGALLRILSSAVPALGSSWRPVVAILAVLSMIGGNLGALAQSNIKRMLAYSSIAHAGYLLTALVAAPAVAGEAVLFYLVSYAAVNLGSFGVLAALARDGREPLSLEDMAGLARRRPALAAALSVFLISLTGIPISGGFVGKFYLFGAAVSAGHAELAVVGVLMSAVSAYYYLRVVVAMYMREALGEDPWSAVGPGAGLALSVSAAALLFLGIYPAPLLALCRLAASTLH